MAFIKGIYWTILVIIFGLLQFWIGLGYSSYSSMIEISFHELTKDGVLLFFSLGITMSVTMDYHFDEYKAKVGNLWKTTGFVFVPLVMITFVVISYLIIKFNPEPNKEELISTLNVCVLCISSVFALIGKSYLFMKQRIDKSWR